MADRRLILTQIPADFSPESDIPIGPWCFSQAEFVYPEWEQIDFDSPFKNPAERVNADVATRRLANQLASDWSNRQNTVNNRNYSPLYWRTLMIEWFVLSVQATWYRYCLVQLMVDRYRNEILTVPVYAGDNNWKCLNQETYFNLLMSDPEFDFWLSSQFVRKLAPESWKLVDAEVGDFSDSKIPSARQFMRPNRIAGFYRSAVGRLSVDTVPGMKIAKILFSIYVNFLPKRQPRNDDGLGADDEFLSIFPDNYLSLLNNILDKTLPAAFDHLFEKFEAKAKTWRYVGGRLLVDNLATVVTEARFRLAHAAEAGERLVGCQHGGWYGTASTIAWAAETDYRHHAFITWGWRGQQDLEGTFVPLPTPYLAPLRNRHRFRERSLVFVGATIFLKVRLLDSIPSPPRWVAYRKMKRQFIASLNSSPRKALIYRPHLRGAPNLLDGDYIQHHFPNVPIYDGDLTSKILGCRLLVLDHPGTTLHLALAANVPTVCFWHPNDWPLSRQGNQSFEALRECGILHATPESAANYINNVWDSVEGWWGAAERQSARRQWCREHARTKPFWWLDWISALWRLAKNPS